jgi:type IV secretion system protein VirB9
MLLSATMLAGCATFKPPTISYDSDVPPLPAVPAPVTEQPPRPLHTPPAWTVAHGGNAANTPSGRVNANAAARVSRGARATTTPSRSIPGAKARSIRSMPRPGRSPTSRSSRAKPDRRGPDRRRRHRPLDHRRYRERTGLTRRVHILVKPTRPDITTNLVITTDRRIYMLELRAGEPYMPAVAWAYPALPASQRGTVPATPIIPAAAARHYRYGASPATRRPGGRSPSMTTAGVYVEFPRGIAQGEMPPIFVLGTDGEPQLVNSRIHQNILIVDRIFGAAELRLGSGKQQQTVRIVRTDGKPAS